MAGSSHGVCRRRLAVAGKGGVGDGTPRRASCVGWPRRRVGRLHARSRPSQSSLPRVGCEAGEAKRRRRLPRLRSAPSAYGWAVTSRVRRISIQAQARSRWLEPTPPNRPGTCHGSRWTEPGWELVPRSVLRASSPNPKVGRTCWEWWEPHLATETSISSGWTQLDRSSGPTLGIGQRSCSADTSR